MCSAVTSCFIKVLSWTTLLVMYIVAWEWARQSFRRLLTSKEDDGEKKKVNPIHYTEMMLKDEAFVNEGS